MNLKNIFFFVLLISFNIWAANPYEGYSLTTLQAKIQRLQAEQNKLQTVISNCENWHGDSYGGENVNHPCTSFSWTGFKKVDIQKLKTDADSVAYELKAANETLSQKKIAAGAGVSVDELNFKLDGQMLLIDIKELKNKLNNNDAQIQKINEKMNNTLLGQYTKYVTNTAIKTALNGEANICDAAAKCDSTKKNKKVIEELSQKVRSFEDWKKDQEAEGLTPQKTRPPASFDGGTST